jgi:hypothetical protein
MRLPTWTLLPVLQAIQALRLRQIVPITLQTSATLQGEELTLHLHLRSSNYPAVSQWPGT